MTWGYFIFTLLTKPNQMKKLLVIGGTQYIGRYLVEQLIRLEKYDITLFNRGKTNTDIFPNLNKIHGDRNTDDILKISRQYWDIIIDVSCYFPNPLNKLLDTLEGKVGRYIFVSTASLYQLNPEATQPMDENTAIVSCKEEEKTDTTVSTYNQRKSECEKVLQSKEWLDVIIFRLGLVVGKYDWTDRLYYWLHKAYTQDEILIPNHGKNIISYSDVSDLSRILIRAIRIKNKHIIYNANSYNASLFDFISKIIERGNKSPKLINITPEEFKKQELKPWTDLPLWVNGDYFTLNNSRLKNEFNIHYNSLDETADALFDYCNNDLKWRAPNTSIASLPLEKEQQIIAEIKSKV